jgi:hypothetical protein
MPQVFDPSFTGKTITQIKPSCSFLTSALGAFLRSLSGVQYMNQLNHNNTSEIFTICRENFMTIPVVIYARKDFFLIDKVNEKIQLVQAAGLIDYWHSQAIDKKNLKADDSSGQPIKLSLRHLLGSFAIWMFGLIIALIMFMAENCKFRLMRRQRNGRVVAVVGAKQRKTRLSSISRRFPLFIRVAH